MHDEMRELAALQRQVFTSSDAHGLGYSDRAIRRSVDHRLWVRLRRGAFVFADHWAGCTAEQRHLLVARAVARPLAGRVAVSHTTGSLARGVQLWNPRLDLVHVTRLDGRSGGLEHGVAHHDPPLGMAACQHLVDDLGADPDFLAVPAEVAVAGTMLLHGLDQAVVAADSAVHQDLVDGQELADLVESWQRTPQSRHVRFATRLVDGRSESPGETLGRLVFWRGGLPRPELQMAIEGPGGQVARTDYAWEDYGVVGEFDGKVKYMRRRREGETASDVVVREKRREEWIVETGRLVRRLVWAEIFTPIIVVARFRRALESGRRHIA